EQADDDQDVVDQPHDGGDGEAPLEPERDVDEHAGHGHRQGPEGVGPQDAADDRRHVVQADQGEVSHLLPQGLLDGLPPLLAHGPGADHELHALGALGRVHPLDHGVVHAARGEGRADVLLGGFLLEAQRPQGPAGEVHAVVEVQENPGQDRHQGQQARGDQAGPTPLHEGEVEPRLMLHARLTPAAPNIRSGLRTRPLSTMARSRNRVTNTAVIMLAMTPMDRVTAKPRTGPVPRQARAAAAISVVTLASRMALRALRKPTSMAARTVDPACSSSRMRSKMTTLASTAMPTDRMMPAMPGRVRVALMPARVPSTMMPYRTSARLAARPGRR